VQLLIANVLDRTPACKVRAAQDLCIPSTQTVVLDDPCATMYKQLLGMLPFVKLEKFTFVDLVTLPFVNPCNTAICQNMQLEIISTI